MNSINRQVAVIKPKEPYVAWINPLPGMADDPSGIESLNNDSTALLLLHFDDGEESLQFLKKIYKRIFEMKLESWSSDRIEWPEKTNWAYDQKFQRMRRAVAPQRRLCGRRCSFCRSR